MATGAYSGYPTRLLLSETWGVTDSAIRKYAAEAHRAVGADSEEKKWLQASMAALCQDVRRRAATTFSTATGMPDFKAELDAIELAAEFLALLEPSVAVVAPVTRIEFLLTDEDKPVKDTP